MIGFAGGWPDADLEDLCRQGARNFVLFTRNCRSLEEIQRLTARLQDLTGGDALVAIDHEGGLVNRLRSAGVEWPSQMAQAACGDSELVCASSVACGSMLASLG